MSLLGNDLIRGLLGNLATSALGNKPTAPTAPTAPNPANPTPPTTANAGTQGILGSGGKYGGGRLQQITQNPAFMEGLRMLSAGGRGTDLTTAMTANAKIKKQQMIFDQAKKKQDFITKYADNVPEKDKALFMAMPELYLKNKYTKASSERVNLQMPGGKSPITLDLKDPAGKAQFNQLIKLGAYEVGKPTVQATSLEGIGGLSKTTRAATEKEIISGNQLLENLKKMEIFYQPEFLEYKGKAKKEIFEILDKTGMGSEEQNAFIQRYNRWDQVNNQYFNNYRKLITGVAAGEKEIGWLQSSIPSSKDSPRVYQAKVNLQKEIQQKIIDNASAFNKLGLGAAIDSKTGITPAFKKYLKDNKIRPSKESILATFNSYKDMQYKLPQIKQIMSNEFKGIDWESILTK